MLAPNRGPPPLTPRTGAASKPQQLAKQPQGCHRQSHRQRWNQGLRQRGQISWISSADGCGVGGEGEGVRRSGGRRGQGGGAAAAPTTSAPLPSILAVRPPARPPTLLLVVAAFLAAAGLAPFLVATVLTTTGAAAAGAGAFLPVEDFFALQQGGCAVMPRRKTVVYRPTQSPMHDGPPPPAKPRRTWRAFWPRRTWASFWQRWPASSWSLRAWASLPQGPAPHQSVGLGGGVGAVCSRGSSGGAGSDGDSSRQVAPPAPARVFALFCHYAPRPRRAPARRAPRVGLQLPPAACLPPLQASWSSRSCSPPASSQPGPCSSCQSPWAAS